MAIELFDVQATFGGVKPGQRQPGTAASLLEEMDRLGIARALVRLAPEDLAPDAARANAVLFRETKGQPRLLPCPVVVPAAGDFPPEKEQIDRLLAQGARAVWIRPDRDAWSLEPWSAGPLLDELARRRIPVFCLERSVGQEKLAVLAARYPDLPFILAEVGYRTQRTLLPLLRTFPNIHLSLGSNYTVHHGIEQLVQAVGPARLLFGSGYPEATPATAITQLTYADLADDDRQAIAASNLARLLGGIQQ